MANLNSVEASIVNIRNIMPGIVLTFHNCMRKYLPDVLDNISNILTNDVKLQTYLKYKAPNSIREFYKDGEIQFDYLKCIDPLNLVKVFTCSEISNGDTVEGTETNVYTLFFKDFFNTLKNNQDTYSKIKESMNNEFTMYGEDPYITSIRSPYLVEINLSEMGSIGTRSTYFDTFNVPRMGIKTVTNFKITEFMQSNNNNDYLNKNPELYGSFKNELNKRKHSEILVGQIDYQTLSIRLIRMYNEIFAAVANNDEYLEIIKNLDTFNDESGENHFEKIKNRFYWETFVILSKILKSEAVAKETEYETNTEDVLPKGTPEFIERIKTLIDEKLNALINDCSMSMALTLLAKVGRTEIAYPYDINRDMLNGILDVTLEDISYFNNKFDNTDIDKESELYNYLNPLNRKKSGSIVRKRMLDFVTLSWLAQKNYNSNFNGFNYISHLYNKDSGNYEFQSYRGREFDDNKKGSIIYKFAVRNLQEIYSNMTYTANFSHNIVDMKGNKYIYKSTIELARAAIDLYIVDTDVKLFLNLGYSDREKSAFLITNNNYDTNTLKNHRALASIYKAGVHILFKLIYVLEGVKKYSEFTKSNHIPPEHAERYVKVKAQLKEILNALKNFKDDGIYTINLCDNYQNFAHTAGNIFPCIQYSLGAFISGKLTSVNRITDVFTDKDDRSYVTNDILAALYTFDKLETSKVIKIDDGFKNYHMTKFNNIASVYAGTDSRYIDEISQEFDPDGDIVTTLEQFCSLDNPELRAIHRNLYESYENMKQGFDFEIKSQLLSVETFDLLDKSIDYLKKEDKTIEGIALTSSIVTYANDVFNMDINDKSAEDIKKFNSRIEEFDNKLLKSLDDLQEDF